MMPLNLHEISVTCKKVSFWTFFLLFLNFYIFFSIFTIFFRNYTIFPPNFTIFLRFLFERFFRHFTIFYKYYDFFQILQFFIQILRFFPNFTTFFKFYHFFRILRFFTVSRCPFGTFFLLFFEEKNTFKNFERNCSKIYQIYSWSGFRVNLILTHNCFIFIRKKWKKSFE